MIVTSVFIGVINYCPSNGSYNSSKTTFLQVRCIPNMFGILYDCLKMTSTYRMKLNRSLMQALGYKWADWAFVQGAKFYRMSKCRRHRMKEQELPNVTNHLPEHLAP